MTSKPPAFLSNDAHLPGPMGELLVEADGCASHGFLIGAGACVVGALGALLALGGVEGTTLDDQLQTLRETCGLPEVLVRVFVEYNRRRHHISATFLHVVTDAIRAAAYEIIVVAPERTARTEYFALMMDSLEPSAANRQEPADDTKIVVTSTLADSGHVSRMA
jgi:hypothetical protein